MVFYIHKEEEVIKMNDKKIEQALAGFQEKAKMYEAKARVLNTAIADYEAKLEALEAFKRAYTDGYGVDDDELEDFAQEGEFETFTWLQNGVEVAAGRVEKDMED